MNVQRRVVLGRISYGAGNYMDASTLPDGEVTWTMLLSYNYNTVQLQRWGVEEGESSVNY
jgi:hypothetical protein